jgi:DNA polymerase III subunit epsilon
MSVGRCIEMGIFHIANVPANRTVDRLGGTSQRLLLDHADFVALDFETASADFASICQIGIVKFRDGAVVETLNTLVNPEDWFDGFNVGIHGIHAEDVVNALIFPEIYVRLRVLLEGEVVVTHTHFDRTALRQVFEKYSLESFSTEWLDSAKVARRAWPERFATTGYGLANVARFLGIAFKHHDALEDARSAGEVVLSAMRATDMSFHQMRICAKRESLGVIVQPGNPNGSLHGEVVVFTGALSMPHHESAALAAKHGCEVAAGVTKHTSILVVGAQDIRMLAKGMLKSSKHRKAETLIKAGQSLRIIQETDFVAMCNENGAESLAA